MSHTKGKPSKKVYGRKSGKSTKRVPPHLVWKFEPKLENEGVILHSILGIYSIDYYDRIVNDVRNLITQLIRNHGFNDGPFRYKTLMNYTVALIEGRNPENPGWLATSEVYRVPSQLGPNFCQLIADYMKSTDASLKPKYYHVILTTLNIIRMVEGLVDADLRSVTDKATQIDQELLDEFTNYVDKQIKLKKFDNNVNFFKSRFNLVKKGPNGVPKIESAIQEAIALLDSKLYRPFRVICNELGADYLVEYLESLVEYVSQGEDIPTIGQSTQSVQMKTEQTTRLRVLAKIPDKGCKTRLVAIVDFWSQLVLGPIRADVQSLIEAKFGKTDFRLNQDSGVSAMVDFQRLCLEQHTIVKNGKTIRLDPKDLYFYDMSSWTDRFHRDLQKVVMRKRFGPRLAEAWAQLTVHCDWYYPELGSTIKYGQGQGMGTNGSFDIATLTDHLFINFIIDEKSGLKGLFPQNACYGKVGDDLWIYDPLKIIPGYYEKINLPINLSKSKEFVNGNSIAEFCARTFFNGVDVSRISPGIISKSKNFRYIPLLLGICSSRGIQLDATSFKSLNRKVKGSEESYLDRLQDWIAAYLLIAQIEQGSCWKSLDLAYLETGHWLKGELSSRVLSDAKLRSRLLIGYSIVTLADNIQKIKDKLFSLCYGDDQELTWSMSTPSDEDANLFDINSESYENVLDYVDQDILTPKQVIVLGRYVDQHRQINGEFFRLTRSLQNCKNPEDLYNVAQEIARLAQRSCYDSQNINYSANRVYDTQFNIVKTLDRMTEDYTILTDIKPEQLDIILQGLQYDNIATEWEGYLPVLQVDNTPSADTGPEPELGNIAKLYDKLMD